MDARSRGEVAGDDGRIEGCCIWSDLENHKVMLIWGEDIG